MDGLTAVGHLDLPLVFKISFGSDNRRVTYPRGRHCHFDSLRGTVERLYSLSASSFYIAYTDDDGDETAIKSDLDLVEAVQYFGSGCDDNVSSYTSATASTSASFDSTLTGGGSGGEKVTLRIQVVVEYDGPALSETGSIAESLSDRESGWGGDNDGASGRSSQWTEGSEEWAEGQAERDRRDGVASGTRVVIEEDWDDESIDLSHDPFLPLAPERSSVPSHPLAQSFGPSSSSSSSSDSQSARLASIGSSPISEGFLADFDPSTPSHDDAGTLHPADHDANWGAVEGNDDVDARTSMPYDGADAIEHGGPKDAEPSSETRYTTRSTVASSVPSIDGPQSSRESRLSSSRQVNGQSGSSGNSQRQPLVPSSSHSTASSAASGLEQSEFGARWLREQGEMLKKRAALPGARPVADNKGKQRSSAISALSDDDDDDNSNFVEGALALERAESGKWYYNYSAGSSRDSLGIDGDKRLSRSSGSSLRPFAVGSSSIPPSSIPTSSAGSPSFVGDDQPPISLNSKSRHDDHQPSSSQSAQLSSVEGIPLEVLRIAAEEETGVVAPPKYAPDCSACGIRLTYMRYACTRCGEGEKRDEHGKLRAGPHHHHHHHHHSHRSHHHQPHLHHHPHSRCPPRRLASDPIRDPGPSAQLSEEEDEDDGYASDGTELVGHRKHSQFGSSSISSNASASASVTSLGSMTSSIGSHKPLPQLPPVEDQRGFELCASCVELHGHEHSREFFKRRTETGAWDFSGGDNAGAGHAFREIVWSGIAHGGWKDVEYDGDIVCSICDSDISRNRFKCVSCPKFDLCKQCYQRVEDIHPVHAFLSVPDREGAPAAESFAAGQLVQHPGAFCHNCLQNIVGPRFHCAICPSWDLCAACESLPSTSALGGTHSIDHIMMKIPVPLGNAEVEQVSRRVRDQWLQQDAQAVAAAQTPMRIQTGQGSIPVGPNAPRAADGILSPPQRSPASQTSGITSPPLSTSPSSLPPPPVHPSRSAWAGPAINAAAQPASLSQGRPGREEAAVSEPRNRIGPWSISLSSSGLSFRRTSSNGTAASTANPPRTGHRCSCDSCGTYLSSTRYQCANCPSDPVAFNLCPACEAKSYLVHDPKHAFLRIDRPVDFQIRSRAPLLPLLYSAPVGQTVDPSLPPMRADVAERQAAVRNQNDPIAHLRFLYHPSTVCDFCMIPITGCWLRCAVCPSSFDLCSDCHRSIEHDRDHIFLVLKSAVDMQVFRECTALSAETSRPLIPQRIYLPS